MNIILGKGRGERESEGVVVVVVVPVNEIMKNRCCYVRSVGYLTKRLVFTNH